MRMTPGPATKKPYGLYGGNNNSLSTSLAPEVETMKVIVLGKANIGKTSLSRRYVHNEFNSVESTVSTYLCLLVGPQTAELPLSFPVTALAASRSFGSCLCWQPLWLGVVYLVYFFFCVGSDWRSFIL